ncbi:MAG: 50S ribosomal protein L7 [candidate division WS2 bacterium]|nr:50S ribosomal protein L7 [Candidatus Lithacetigena glycinireducens]MBT9174795.1 50S ribosomal protein L7 [Candidatus Lithacetigena glycinireducens]
MKKEEIIEVVEKMTVLELAELVKALEERFGVSAAMPMMMAGTAPAAQAVPHEEQTEFDVILKEVGDRKVQVIKAVREVTTLGLKEAKELIESAPSLVKEKTNKIEAEEIKAKLEAVGAKIEIR